MSMRVQYWPAEIPAEVDQLSSGTVTISYKDDVNKVGMELVTFYPSAVSALNHINEIREQLVKLVEASWEPVTVPDGWDKVEA